MPSSTELRVFISSTFRDLQEEREHLVKKIFPEIRALCRERGVTFTEVDLRWGLTEEEATLGRVIRICLEEVDKCRPYFIGLIGERYGWSPEFHEIAMDPELLSKYPWIEEAALDGASVTEMEFIHGIFAPEIDGGSAYFYRRDGDTSEADNPEKLRRLIERAMGSGHPMREFTTADVLGQMVHDDLVAMIDCNWPERVAPSALELERRTHGAFAASRTRAYIPNPSYLKPLNAWTAEAELPMVVIADSGLGKSSLIAYSVDAYRRRNPTALVIEHYVGASQSSGSAYAVMRHIIDEIRERFDIKEELPSGALQVEQTFPNWLYRADHLARQEGIPLLIAIDALNQLDGQGQSLSWLPKKIPQGLRLLVSTTPGESYGGLHERDWIELEVPPVDDPRNRASIVVRYLAEFHKSISAGQLSRISADPKSSSPLFLRVIAEELRLHGEHETLDDIIDRYLSVENLDEVFQRVLERMEGDYGRELVEHILRLMWGSRSGLSETELLEITCCTRLELSTLLYALDFHLIRTNGLLGFFHTYLRTAVGQRYLPDEVHEREVHRELARYFSSTEVTYRSASELVYQLRVAEQWEDLLAALATIPIFKILLLNNDRLAILGCWQVLTAMGHDLEPAYRTGLDDYRSIASVDQMASAVNQLSGLFGGIGQFEVQRRLVLDLAELAAQSDSPVIQGTVEFGVAVVHHHRGEFADAIIHLERARVISEQSGSQAELLSILNNLGTAHRCQGNLADALMYHEQAGRISSEIGDREMLGVSLNNRGTIYRIQGDHERALECFRAYQEIAEAMGDRWNLAYAVGNLGCVYMDMGDYEPALRCCIEQRLICEDLGDLHLITYAEFNMGAIHCELGDYDEALRCYQRVKAISDEIGDRRGAAGATQSIGSISYERKEYSKALDAYFAALETYRQVGSVEEIGSCLHDIVDLQLKILEDDLPMPENLSTYVPGMTDSNWRSAVAELATEFARESVDLLERSGNRFDSVVGKIFLCRLQFLSGEREQAIEQLGQMLAELPEDELQASVQYWLWKMMVQTASSAVDGHRLQSASHASHALQLYETIYARKPSRLYRKVIEELREYSGEPVGDLETSAGEAKENV